MIRIVEGDCLTEMRRMALEGQRFDSLVSDTPYHLQSITKRFGGPTSAAAQHGADGAFGRLSRGFMGKTWDGGNIAQNPDVWRAAYRVLKPGGWLLAMSATRTQHRMVCAIEDAGFEIRDMIGWMYATGFAKNRTMREGESVGLKPAWEPVCVARKPLGESTVQANLDRYGVGALRAQDCRVEPTGESRARIGEASEDRRYADRGSTNFAMKPGIRGGAPEGRFPANLILDGSDEVRALFPNSAGQLAASSTADRPKTNMIYGAFRHNASPMQPRADDDLSAARFFYCAKATASERAFNHPTVKPVALMRYLVRLVTPEGGTVLDPFAGTGQTGFAANLEGRRAVLIEKEADYAQGLRARFSPAPRRRII